MPKHTPKIEITKIMNIQKWHKRLFNDDETLKPDENDYYVKFNFFMFNDFIKAQPLTEDLEYFLKNFKFGVLKEIVGPLYATIYIQKANAKLDKGIDLEVLQSITKYLNSISYPEKPKDEQLRIDLLRMINESIKNNSDGNSVNAEQTMGSNEMPGKANVEKLDSNSQNDDDRSIDSNEQVNLQPYDTISIGGDDLSVNSQTVEDDDGSIDFEGSVSLKEYKEKDESVKNFFTCDSDDLSIESSVHLNEVEDLENFDNNSYESDFESENEDNEDVENYEDDFVSFPHEDYLEMLKNKYDLNKIQKTNTTAEWLNDFKTFVTKNVKDINFASEFLRLHDFAKLSEYFDNSDVSYLFFIAYMSIILQTKTADLKQISNDLTALNNSLINSLNESQKAIFNSLIQIARNLQTKPFYNTVDDALKISQPFALFFTLHSIGNFLFNLTKSLPEDYPCKLTKKQITDLDEHNDGASVAEEVEEELGMYEQDFKGFLVDEFKDESKIDFERLQLIQEDLSKQRLNEDLGFPKDHQFILILIEKFKSNNSSNLFSIIADMINESKDFAEYFVTNDIGDFLFKELKLPINECAILQIFAYPQSPSNESLQQINKTIREYYENDYNGAQNFVKHFIQPLPNGKSNANAHALINLLKEISEDVERYTPIEINIKRSLQDETTLTTEQILNTIYNKLEGLNIIPNNGISTITDEDKNTLLKELSQLMNLAQGNRLNKENATQIYTLLSGYGKFQSDSNLSYDDLNQSLNSIIKTLSKIVQPVQPEHNALKNSNSSSNANNGPKTVIRQRSASFSLPKTNNANSVTCSKDDLDLLNRQDSKNFSDIPVNLLYGSSIYNQKKLDIISDQPQPQIITLYASNDPVDTPSMDPVNQTQVDNVKISTSPTSVYAPSSGQEYSFSLKRKQESASSIDGVNQSNPSLLDTSPIGETKTYHHARLDINTITNGEDKNKKLALTIMNMIENIVSRSPNLKVKTDNPLAAAIAHVYYNDYLKDLIPGNYQNKTFNRTPNKEKLESDAQTILNVLIPNKKEFKTNIAECPWYKAALEVRPDLTSRPTLNI